MPLDTQGKRMTGNFQPFRDPVFTVSIDPDCFSGFGNSLMVEAVDRDGFFAEDPAQKAAGFDPYFMDQRVPG